MPNLSVVLGTTHAWPSSRECLESLVPQAEELGAEIILGDQTGRALPQPVPDWLRRVRVVHAPNASIFALRARALAIATGDVVAFTEDHCLPAPDWCRRMLDAHAQHPEAAAIGGAVTNRSTGSLTDWASFLLTFGPFFPPLNGATIGRTPPPANLSLKRSAFPQKPLEEGDLEFDVMPGLFAGRRIVYDDRILVSHEQSDGALRMLLMHFHNGRSTTGLAHRLPAAGRRRILAEWWLRPKRALEGSLPLLAHKPALAGQRRRLRWPMAAFACFHAAGEIAGLLLGGAGNSPEALE